MNESLEIVMPAHTPHASVHKQYIKNIIQYYPSI